MPVRPGSTARSVHVNFWRGAGNQESLTLVSEDAVVGCSGDGMPL